MPLVVILPGSGDLGAGEVARVLTGRGHEVVTLDAARIEAVTWAHRISDGRPSTTLTTPTGRIIEDADIGAVLNRMIAPSPTRFARSSDRDRTYATVEWQALLVGWLAALGGRVVGAVDGQGLVVEHAPLQWLGWARAAGLRTRASRGIPDVARPALAAVDESAVLERYVVVDGRVVGAPARPIRQVAEGVCRLAAFAGCDVLAVDVTAGRDGGEFVGVDVRPHLAGPVLTAVADLLVDRVRRQRQEDRWAS